MGLYKELEEYNKQNYCPMHMPGHKRNTKLLGNKLPYNIDITEIDGFDDLHNPKGIIKRIEDKAKMLYGSKRSFALINGSTCGILAGIRAVVKPNDKILVARNSHKSVYHAIEINQLKSLYLMPKINEFGIEETISPKDVKEQLNKNEDIKLVVITSPTYEGYISKIKEIVEIAHEHKIPVLVDEAHGAHLNFVSDLKQKEALNSGADIVIQSLHKTLPALTQTAIMHIQGNLVDENNIENQLAIFETSSPSYILMASIEEALDIIKQDGAKLFENYKSNLLEFYKEAKKLEKLKILGNEISKEIVYDNGKIVVLTNQTNVTGRKLADILRKQYKIEVEMSSINHVIAMTSICDSDSNFSRLITALKEIDKKLKFKIYSDEEKMKNENSFKLEIPKQELTINEAISSEKNNLCNFKEVEGKVSKEYVWVYPPGIPIIVPGEVISKNALEKIESFINAGIEIRTSKKQACCNMIELC